MEVEYTIEKIQKKIAMWNKMGLSIGLVPTMGYLHPGHGNLIKRAKEENDKVIVSIFVNPTQFGKGEDLDKYPRDLEKDTRLISGIGADLVFHPDVNELYPNYPGYTRISVSNLSDYLCGASRPGHFDGVCLVVNKLFNIIQPKRAYFGEKDYQQLAIIKNMVVDLNMPVEIVACPIVREETGLALSSRNSYLTATEKQSATVLYQSLLLGKTMIEQGKTNTSEIIKEMQKKILKESNTKIDYIQVVCPTKLTPLESISDKAVIALAVFFGKTRLIDNILV